MRLGYRYGHSRGDRRRAKQCVLHRELCSMSQCSAFQTGGSNRRQQLDMHVSLFVGEETAQVRKQVVIANERSNRVWLAIA